MVVALLVGVVLLPFWVKGTPRPYKWPQYLLSSMLSSKNICEHMRPFKCYVTLFYWKFNTHPPHCNSNEVEPYIFVTLFLGNTTPSRPLLRYITLEWPPKRRENIASFKAPQESAVESYLNYVFNMRNVPFCHKPSHFIYYRSDVTVL